MTALLYVPLFFASCALADDAGDRAAIRRVIAGLNERPLRAELFTEDSGARAELERLPKPGRVELRSQKAVVEPIFQPRAGGATVTISYEPWGEATIDFPGRPLVIEIFTGRAIRLITPDVALADGAWVYPDRAGETQTIGLLLVMRKEEGTWKIASLRRLASR